MRAEEAWPAQTMLLTPRRFQLLDAFRKGALSPVEATRVILDRLDALQPKINAFCIVDREGALAAARASEGAGRAAKRPDGSTVCR